MKNNSHLFDNTRLPDHVNNKLLEWSTKYNLTHSQKRILLDIAIDLTSWGEDRFLMDFISKCHEKEREKAWKLIEQIYNDRKEKGPFYSASKTDKFPITNIIEKQSVNVINDNRPLFGECPVFSERTRCCGLLTLDAVMGCSFGCSYCAVQTFYIRNSITFHKNLFEKLKSVKLNPEKIYHIGTGQSSDSLLWGNKNRLLDALIEFAWRNPNVILEMKSKSDNIAYLIERELPKNILFTWSLNPQIVIDNEESLTASLDKRLNTAEKILDKGSFIGFHFHPILWFDGWGKEYDALFASVKERFPAEKVITLSFGTLTLIKPTIKKIRSFAKKTQILRTELYSTEGKMSYSHQLKKELLSKGVSAFSDYKNKSFIYFCMESPKLWEEVLGYDYNSNKEFEVTMKSFYWEKMKLGN